MIIIRYKPPEAEAGEHYYKEIAKQNPRQSKARRAILDRCFFLKLILDRWFKKN